MTDQPVQKPPERNAIGGLFFDVYNSLGPGLVSVVGFLPTILFNYGAAKLNYSVNQSYFWAIVAFFFSAIYYPYYAFFVAPSPSYAAAVLGGAKRLARR